MRIIVSKQAIYHSLSNIAHATTNSSYPYHPTPPAPLNYSILFNNSNPKRIPTKPIEYFRGILWLCSEMGWSAYQDVKWSIMCLLFLFILFCHCVSLTLNAQHIFVECEAIWCVMRTLVLARRIVQHAHRNGTPLNIMWTKMNRQIEMNLSMYGFIYAFEFILRLTLSYL